jgi:hypothetical protein
MTEIKHERNKVIGFSYRHYIHENPVEHGFTNLPECYDWCSAADYSGVKGLVNIEML